MKKTLLFIIIFVFACLNVFATQTPIPTTTPTPFPTVTATVTPTSIPMYTADKVFAYPNPAKGIVNIAYPVLTGKVVTKVKVLLHSILGVKVAEVTETSRLNGIVTFNIEKFPTGIYLYRVIVQYADNTEIRYGYDRLAIIK